jgi:hypothetical protein
MRGRVLGGLSRRSMIRLLAMGAGLIGGGSLFAADAFAAKRKSSAKASTKAKPTSKSGFDWHPERSPSGPLAIIVSLTKQRVYVYRNGIQIGSSSCSTGMEGYETPTGVFTILQKEEEHYSSLYDDASMPHMERLTWDGIALHAGKLPGYPASHGCVRLPAAFAEKLYSVTQIGTPVIIADDATHPSSVYDPGLLLGAEAKQELGKTKGKKKPAFAKSDAVTSILVSSADKSIYVIQKGDIVAEGKAEIADPKKPLGSNVFVLEKGDENGFTWQATGYSTGKAGAKKPSSSIVERVTPPPEVQAAIDERMKPGMVFVTTDQLATPDTRSAKDFTVMDAEEKKK